MTKKTPFRLFVYAAIALLATENGAYAQTKPPPRQVPPIFASPGPGLTAEQLNQQNKRAAELVAACRNHYSHSNLVPKRGPEGSSPNPTPAFPPHEDGEFAVDFEKFCRFLLKGLGM